MTIQQPTGLLTCIFGLCCSTAATAGSPVGTVTNTPGLVAFWTFGEEAGQPRRSVGTPDAHSLLEIGGPIARIAGGPFSGYAAELNGKQYLHIPHAETGDLNISGPRAQVSMFAVVRIVDLKRSRTIAGMWCEGKGANDDSGTRQYALLMNMPTDRYYTQEGPGGGPRGINPYYHGRGIFAYDPARHAATKPMGGSDFTVGARYAVGNRLGEGSATVGRFGGLAVFNRALSEAEMKRLHEAARIEALP